MASRYACLTRWLSWTAATIAGLCVGGAVLVLANELGLGGALAEVSYINYTWLAVVSVLGPMFYSAIIGAITGLAQWLLLRRWFQKTGWWVPVTAGCLMAGSYAFFFVERVANRVFDPFPLAHFGLYVPPPIVMVVAGLGPGIVLGIGQWLVLRRQIPRPGWWIVANIVAWPAGMFLTFCVQNLLQFCVQDLLHAWSCLPCGPQPYISMRYLFLSPALSTWDLFGLLAVGAVVGMLTGLVLIYPKGSSQGCG